MRSKTPILKMFSHTLHCLRRGKYGVSAAYATLSGKISAKSKLPLQQCTEIVCKGTKLFVNPNIKDVKI